MDDDVQNKNPFQSGISLVLHGQVYGARVLRQTRKSDVWEVGVRDGAPRLDDIRQLNY